MTSVAFLSNVFFGFSSSFFFYISKKTVFLQRKSFLTGKLPEWSIGTVSKTVVRVTVPRVRISHFPLIFSEYLFRKSSIKILFSSFICLCEQNAIFHFFYTKFFPNLIDRLSFLYCVFPIFLLYAETVFKQPSNNF